MKTKTKELILLLLDYLMTQSQFECVRLEVLSISVVYYLMQIEGDVPESILDFNLFVEKKLQIGKTEIFAIEIQILAALPPGFFTMFTFYDIIGLIVSNARLISTNIRKTEQRAIRLALNYYILQNAGFTVENLSFAAVAFIVNELEDISIDSIIRQLSENSMFSSLNANLNEVIRLADHLASTPRGGLGFSHAEPEMSDENE
jgi:hypothetical protein